MNRTKSSGKSFSHSVLSQLSIIIIISRFQFFIDVHLPGLRFLNELWMFSPTLKILQYLAVLITPCNADNFHFEQSYPERLPPLRKINHRKEFFLTR